MQRYEIKAHKSIIRSFKEEIEEQEEYITLMENEIEHIKKEMSEKKRTLESVHTNHGIYGHCETNKADK
jgi:predicted RNase H-like nuclease (RuvC/YqgF family)